MIDYSDVKIGFYQARNNGELYTIYVYDIKPDSFSSIGFNTYSNIVEISDTKHESWHWDNSRTIFSTARWINQDNMLIRNILHMIFENKFNYIERDMRDL